MLPVIAFRELDPSTITIQERGGAATRKSHKTTRSTLHAPMCEAAKQLCTRPRPRTRNPPRAYPPAIRSVHCPAQKQPPPTQSRSKSTAFSSEGSAHIPISHHFSLGTRTLHHQNISLEISTLQISISHLKSTLQT